MVAGIRQNFSKSFFTSKAVVNRTNKSERVVLSRFGSFVRTTARTSMRPGGKKNAISRAGQPPRTHVGLLRKLLYFGYDFSRRSVVVGPLKFGGSIGNGVPRLLEEGGTRRTKKRNIYVKRGVRRGQGGRFVSGGSKQMEIGGLMKYRPRPYMEPALKRNLPQLPQLWRNAVR